jgi:hypothetical protein
MSADRRGTFRLGPLGPLVSLGTRAATATLRPIAGVVEAAADVGVSLERRVVNRVLDSDELERVVIVAVNSAHIQAALKQALESDGVAQLIDSLFDSGLIDRFLAGLVDSGTLDRFFDRLLTSEGLWHLIDEIAGSPAVTAAISQQGLGFADQVGDEVRNRSRKADDWMERAARRLIGRQPRVLPAESDPST